MNDIQVLDLGKISSLLHLFVGLFVCLFVCGAGNSQFLSYPYLKTLDTIGNRQRLVFTFGVYQ